VEPRWGSLYSILVLIQMPTRPEQTRPVNWQIWVALLLSLATFISFRLVFVKWPLTRDFPWANLLLLVLSVIALFIGVRRAFAPGRLQVVRGIVGSVVAIVSVAILAGFVFLVFVAARQLPASGGAPQIGQKVSDFNLMDVNGTPVSLSELLTSPIDSRPVRGVLLIFYMYSGCLACNSELRSIQQRIGELDGSGIRTVAISNQSPQVSRGLVNEAGYTFPFLSDVNGDIIRRLDLFDEDSHTARPAAFLLDSSGTVRWRLVSPSVYIRSRPQQILDAAKLLP
jgi:peroxiredoxin